MRVPKNACTTARAHARTGQGLRTPRKMHSAPVPLSLVTPRSTGNTCLSCAVQAAAAAAAAAVASEAVVGSETWNGPPRRPSASCAVPSTHSWYEVEAMADLAWQGAPARLFRHGGSPRLAVRAWRGLVHTPCAWPPLAAARQGCGAPWWRCSGRGRRGGAGRRAARARGAGRWRAERWVR